MMTTNRVRKLEAKIQRNFADRLLYVYERPSGIIEIRRRHPGRVSNHLIIKRYPKWYSHDRILMELWERDTWSREKQITADNVDDQGRLKNMRTVSSQKMNRQMNYEVAKQEGKKPDKSLFDR